MNREVRPHFIRIIGFTLIELLVVLVVLGLLSGLAGPQFIRYLDRAKADAAGLQIHDIGAALDLFYLDIGRYPTTQEGLAALVTHPVDLERWNGPYIRGRGVPVDPWGNAYRYRSPGEHDHYDLYLEHGDSLPEPGARGGD